MSHLHFNWSRLDVFATDAFKTFLNVRLQEKVSPTSPRGGGACVEGKTQPSDESAAENELQQKEGPVINKQRSGGLAGGLIQALIVTELTMGNIPPLVKLVALDDGLNLGDDSEDDENDEDIVGANRDRAGANIGAGVCDLNNAATARGNDENEERERDNGIYTDKDEGGSSTYGSSGDDMSSYFNNEDEGDYAEWDDSTDTFYGVQSCWGEGTDHEGLPAVAHDVERGATTTPAANCRNTACPTNNNNSNNNNKTDTLARFFGPKGLFLKFRITYGGNAAVGVRAVLNKHTKLGKGGEKKGKRDGLPAFDAKVGVTVVGGASSASLAAPPATPSAPSFLSPSSGGGQAKATAAAFPSRPLSGGSESQSKVIVSPTGSPSSFIGAVAVAAEANCGGAGSSTSYADLPTTSKKHTSDATCVLRAQPSPHSYECADGRVKPSAATDKTSECPHHQKLLVPPEGGVAGTRGGRDACGYFSSSSPSSTPPLAASDSTGGTVPNKLPNTTPTTAGTAQSYVEIDVASFDYLPAQHRPRSEERTESSLSHHPNSNVLSMSRESSSPQRSLWETNTSNKPQNAEKRDTNGGSCPEEPFGVGVCIPAHVALSGIVFDGYLCVNLRNNKCDIWLEPESSALLQSAAEWNATYERRKAEAKAKKKEARHQAAKAGVGVGSANGWDEVGRHGDQTHNNTRTADNDEDDADEEEDCEDIHDLLIPSFEYPTPLTRLQVELLLDGVRDVAPLLLSRPLPLILKTVEEGTSFSSSAAAAAPVKGVGSKGRDDHEQVFSSAATGSQMMTHNDLEEHTKDQYEVDEYDEQDDEEEEEVRYNTNTDKSARHVYSHPPKMKGVSLLPRTRSGNGDEEDGEEDSNSETDLFSGGGQHRGGEATSSQRYLSGGGGGLFGYTARPSSRIVAPFANTRKVNVASSTQPQAARLPGKVSSAASSSTLTSMATTENNSSVNNTTHPRRHQGGGLNSSSPQQQASIATVRATNDASPPAGGAMSDTRNANSNDNDKSRASGNKPQGTNSSHFSPSSSSYCSSPTPPPPRFFDHQLVTELVYNELQALLRQHILMPRYVSIPLKLK